MSLILSNREGIERLKKIFFAVNSSTSMICMVIFLFIAVFSPLAYAGTDEKAVIKDIRVAGLYSITKEELLYLLDLETGGAVDPQRVTSGIKRAFLKGIFEDIEVHQERMDEGDGGKYALLRVVVKERDIIKGIDVSGNTHLSDRLIKGHYPLKEGQVMRYDLSEDSVKELRRYLAERGFPQADVRIGVEKTGEPYRVRVVMTVSEGAPLLIRRVKVDGPEEEVRSLMKVAEGDVFDQFRLREDVEKIKNYYRKEGYFSPSVGPYSFSDGELAFKVDPGKRLTVSFEGNSALSSRELQRELPFFDAGDFRNDLVEEASARIVAAYHTKGHPFVQIAPVASVDMDTVSLTFFIFEGERVTIGSVGFSGVTLAEKNLKEIMSLKEDGVYNPDLLFSDRGVLIEFYNALGYLGADVSEPEVTVKDATADIRIVVNEGRRTLVGAVAIEGAKSLPPDEIKRVVGIKEGNPYNEVDISDARFRVIEAYLERGFIDVGVVARSEFDEHGARISFQISEGEQTFFGKTIITGNEKTRWVAVKRDLLHGEGKPFNHGLLTRGRQKLYKLGLFTDITVEPLDRHEAGRDVLVTVKEGNAGAVEFGVGYSDYEQLRGFIDIGYRNLFGMNRRGSLRLELSSIEQRYIASYYEPWFAGRPIPFRALLLREDRTEKSIDTDEVRYRLKRHTATAGFEKKIGDNYKGELYYEFSLVETFDVKPDVILTKEDTGTLAISSIRPGLIYDTRDNPFDPTKGFLAGVTMKVASEMLFSGTDFAKVIFNGSYYRALSKRFVLALSLRGGVAQGFGATNELPLVERFFLGGRSTVRGYEQDTLGPKGVDGTPTGGNAFVLTNLELRTSLGKGLGIVTFIDGGNVWVKADEMNLSLKYTAGLGLRYSTPVGPVRIDYGHKLMREKGESSGEIHFSIGHAF